MMVSLIQSNYHGFGSGIVVPGTGIALNNRGSCFVHDARPPEPASDRSKRPLNTISRASSPRTARRSRLSA